MDNVYKLYNQIKPKHTINTHDEKKKAKGLVSSLAKIKYARIYLRISRFPNNCISH